MPPGNRLSDNPRTSFRARFEVGAELHGDCVVDLSQLPGFKPRRAHGGESQARRGAANGKWIQFSPNSCATSFRSLNISLVAW